MLSQAGAILAAIRHAIPPPEPVPIDAAGAGRYVNHGAADEVLYRRKK